MRQAIRCTIFLTIPTMRMIPRITTRRIASTRVRITRRRPVRHRTFFTLRAAVILIIRLARRAVEVKPKLTARGLA